jgi:transposase
MEARQDKGIRVYSTIVRWLDEILAYFDNRTTSGVVERINNKLKLIKLMSLQILRTSEIGACLIGTAIVSFA